MHSTKKNIFETISALLKNKAHRFTPSGPTIDEIGETAKGIRDIFIRRGVTADEPVCLCVEDRSLLLAAMLASMAGAPPFIFPHAFQPQVLGEVRVARPFRLILTDGAVEPPEWTEVIRMDTCRPGPGDRPLEFVRPPDRAFVYLFTGGSTGKPRIWSKTPANLLCEAINLAQTFGIRQTDLLLSTVPPQHIYGLLGSVLLPFVASAQVLRRTCTFPQEILSTLQNEAATVLVGVPIHYRALRSEGLQRFSLRLALSSAAPLDDADAAFFLDKTGLAITEIYGSTETGGIAMRPYGPGYDTWTPFACIDWKIRADRLAVRSDFISPDLPCDAEGFYVTADRVAKAQGNRFRLLGRTDRIVKVAGKRVDLEEVRERIRRIPGVRDAYVAAVPLRGARQSQIATLVATDLSIRELRAAIRSMDESYGHPRRVRTAMSIPVLPNGKINRQEAERLLFAPHPSRIEKADTAPIPSSPPER
jgi:acyl-coenzyme A synthetase/AMP-(fatty) acid ligase